MEPSLDPIPPGQVQRRERALPQHLRGQAVRRGAVRRLGEASQSVARLAQVRDAAANDDVISGPFYHGTKADLKPGDLITPGYRSNYGHGERTSPWVYMTATLSPLGAELARGDGPGRLYIVEPTGPFVDDPDLTDKKFPGNPTKSYRSRYPLRVVGEVTDWEPHSPEQIKAMMDGQDRLYAMQAERIARIPSAADFDQIHAQADELAREWTPDARVPGLHASHAHQGSRGGGLLGDVVPLGGAGRDQDLRASVPDRRAAELAAGDVPLSGRITDVGAWHEGWVAVIESCVTEIGLSLETRIWIAVDADHDTLRFRRGRRRTRAVVAAKPATRARSAHRYRTRRDLGLRDGSVRRLMVSTNARCASWGRTMAPASNKRIERTSRASRS